MTLFSYLVVPIPCHGSLVPSTSRLLLESDNLFFN